MNPYLHVGDWIKLDKMHSMDLSKSGCEGGRSTIKHSNLMMVSNLSPVTYIIHKCLKYNT
jgi:hypothetical protein